MTDHDITDNIMVMTSMAAYCDCTIKMTVITIAIQYNFTFTQLAMYSTHFNVASYVCLFTL